jgi:hypothetical protein
MSSPRKRLGMSSPPPIGVGGRLRREPQTKVLPQDDTVASSQS